MSKKTVYYIISLILTVLSSTLIFAQGPGCPDVSTSGGSVDCATPCINLTASIFETGQTTSYGVSSIPYAPPYPFTAGTSIFVGQDDIWGGITALPFNFCFYGTSYNQIVVGANGLITFDLTQAGAYCDYVFTATCPTPGPPPGGLYNNSIMGAYLDIDPSVNSGGDVSYAILGTAPCRTFVVNYNNIAEYSCTNQLVTQQIVLYETTNAIEVYIQNLQVCSSWNGGNAVIGIQNATGANGISPPGRNTGPWSATNEAWRFTPDGAPNYVFTWYDSGGNAISNNLTVNVCPTVNSSYTAEIVYTNCDGTIITETDIASVTVNGNIPTVSAGSDTTICLGQSVTIGGSPTASGGAGGPFNYLWTPATGLSSTTISNPVFTPSVVGVYTYGVGATDAGGCTSFDSISVNAIVCCSSTITDTLISNASCDGNCDGSIDITSTGATQFSVDNGLNWSANNVFTNLCAGNYTVIAADALCADTVYVTITEPSPISIPNTPTDPLCNGDNNGQIILAPQGGTPPYTYLWDAAANNQIANPAINLGAGSFMVTVTDAFGCSQDSTFSLTEPTPFTYTTTPVNATCGLPDGSVTIVGFAGGTGGYTYDWGAGPVASNTLLNLTPGTYTVTVADNTTPVGCDTTFTITVGNNPSFTASITGFTDATCNGYNDGTATAGGSDPLVSYNFNWFNAGGQATQTATGLAAGTYDVELTDPNTGCVDTATVTIGEPTLVTVTAVTPVNICLGQSANLTATGANGNGGAYTYNWDAGTFIGSPYVVTPTSNTTYSVFAMDVDGCPSAPVNVTVIVSPGLIVTTDPDFSICAGDPATFSAYGSFGNGNSASYVYTWDDGINIIGTGATQTVSPAFTTTYTVTLDDGCTTPLATAQITITVNPLPPVVFSVDMPSVCLLPAQAFEFSTDTTGGLFNTILWNFGDGNTGSLDTISHLYASSGVYDVTLTLTDTNGCINSLTNPSYVEVYQNPIADFTMTPNPTSMFDPTIHFYDQSTPPPMAIWAWDIGGLDSSYSQNFTYTFPEDTGHYLILLTVTDIHGCEDTTSNTAIVIGEFGIFVPNAFTPDGDGMNDGFFPNGFGINETDYTFFIFDRWGEIIFESHKKFNPWDGTYKGKLVQEGVYAWKLLFTDINGQKHSYVGHVTMIR